PDKVSRDHLRLVSVFTSLSTCCFLFTASPWIFALHRSQMMSLAGSPQTLQYLGFVSLLLALIAVPFRRRTSRVMCALMPC
ncbi:MAG TPA: hypothetical protein VE965_07100, partial [Gammaproteobacteria bacterium]|nr:hypothetical protein [Gammaproteobacteria bacterium]